MQLWNPTSEKPTPVPIILPPSIHSRVNVQPPKLIPPAERSKRIIDLPREKKSKSLISKPAGSEIQPNVGDVPID